MEKEQKNENIKIKLEDSKIKTLTLRKPTAGDLRGIQMSKLGDDVDQFAKLVSRISTPNMLVNDFYDLSITDYTTIMSAFSDFFSNPSQNEG